MKYTEYSVLTKVDNRIIEVVCDAEAREMQEPEEQLPGKVLFNGQTILFEADRLWEVAAIRGVISFDEFSRFYRRLIPLLAELGIRLEDSDDARKSRLESMAEG